MPVISKVANKILIILFFSTLICADGCKEIPKSDPNDELNRSVIYEEEKKAIIETLNEETKAAFQRDYEGWKEKWVHDPTTTKTYINFADSSFSESIGWNEISKFVKTYFNEHPEPEPLPKLVENIDVRLYRNGAWVTYEQKDTLRGLKRETRLMEKTNGQWRIAGMQTTIYGFKPDE